MSWPERGYMWLIIVMMNVNFLLGEVQLALCEFSLIFSCYLCLFSLFFLDFLRLHFVANTKSRQHGQCFFWSNSCRITDRRTATLVSMRNSFQAESELACIFFTSTAPSPYRLSYQSGLRRRGFSKPPLSKVPTPNAHLLTLPLPMCCGICSSTHPMTTKR